MCRVYERRELFRSSSSFCSSFVLLSVLQGHQHYNKCCAIYCILMQDLANHFVSYAPTGGVSTVFHAVRGCESVQTLDGDVLPLTVIWNTASAELEILPEALQSSLSDLRDVFLSDPWIPDWNLSDMSRDEQHKLILKPAWHHTQSLMHSSCCLQGNLSALTSDF